MLCFFVKDLMFPGVIPPVNGFNDFENNQVAAVTLLGNRY